MGHWLWNVLVSIDQTCGVILSPVLFYSVSSPDETISSRAGKLMLANGGSIPWKYPIVKAIVAIVDVIDPGHFPRSIERDEG